MKRGTLLDSDPDFRDPTKLREWLIRNVATSTAVETGASVRTIAKDLRNLLEMRARPRSDAPLVDNQRE